MAEAKKVGTFGSVEIKLVEVRDMKVAFCTVKCEITQRQTTAKKKNELNAKFDEDFSLFVSARTPHTAQPRTSKARRAHTRKTTGR